MSSSRELFAELVRDRELAGGNLYQRLKKVNRLLSDRWWVEDPAGGGGDESRAIDRIEEQCFGPEAGMSLPEMLEVLVAVPEEKVWKQQKYNLRKMHQEMKARQEAQQQNRRQSTGGSAGGKPDSNGHILPLVSPQEQIKQLKQENAQLKQENRRLRKAVKGLQDAINELQAVGV